MTHELTSGDRARIEALGLDADGLTEAVASSAQEQVARAFVARDDLADLREGRGLTVLHETAALALYSPEGRRDLFSAEVEEGELVVKLDGGTVEETRRDGAAVTFRLDVGGIAAIRDSHGATIVVLHETTRLARVFAAAKVSPPWLQAALQALAAQPLASPLLARGLRLRFEDLPDERRQAAFRALIAGLPSPELAPVHAWWHRLPAAQRLHHTTAAATRAFRLLDELHALTESLDPSVSWEVDYEAACRLRDDLECERAVLAAADACSEIDVSLDAVDTAAQRLHGALPFTPRVNEERLRHAAAGAAAAWWLRWVDVGER